MCCTASSLNKRSKRGRQRGPTRHCYHSNIEFQSLDQHGGGGGGEGVGWWGGGGCRQEIEGVRGRESKAEGGRRRGRTG